MAGQALSAGSSSRKRALFGLLDRDGASKMAHRDIAMLLHERHKAPNWWAQMITVAYERARGLRQTHQKADGFSAGCSKTMAAPVGALFRAWEDQKLRDRWLGAKLTIRKATKNKSLRITWADETRVDVMFWPKAKAKTQVVVQHEKLPSADAVTEKKSYWAGRLARLEGLVAS